MTKTKSTKRALLMSALALLMCVSMLIGSTFAWFTDSVVSGSNVITAGNLDIVVEYTLDGEKWNDLDGAHDLFQKGLWEPGHTELVALRITNTGSLALKYVANMNIVNEVPGTNKAGEEFKLSDILTVSTMAMGPFGDDVDEFMAWMTELTISGAFQGGLEEDSFDKTAKFNETNILFEGKDEGNSICRLNAGETAYVFVQVDMPVTVGNEANAKDKDSVPSIEFGINILATQTPYEEDSFGPDYDKDATYPEVTMVATQADLNAAISNGVDTIYLTDGTYTLPASKNNAFTLIGNGNTVIDLTKATGQNLSGTDITFENLTVQGDNANYHGIQHAGNIVYNNVVFNDSTTLYGESVTFNDCTFNLTTRYIWTYGAEEVTFTNCLFNTDGKAVLVYGEGTVDSQVVNFNDCTFGATATATTSAGDNCAAVEIDSSLIKGTYTVNFNGTNTVSDKFNGLYRIKKNQDPSNITVNQNGTVVAAETVTAGTQDELKDALVSGDTVNVTLAAGEYTMPQVNALQGKTLTISGTKDTVVDISAIPTNGSQAYSGTTLVFDGVTVNCATTNYKGFTHAESLTYKNCQINGLQCLFAENVTFENCDFNSNGAEHSVWTYGAKNVTFTDCDFTYADRAVNVYLDNGTGSVNVSFEGCTFTTTNTASKGAVEINSSVFPQGANVSFDDCEGPAYGTMVGISGWDGTDGATANVTVDGAEIDATQWEK